MTFGDAKRRLQRHSPVEGTSSTVFSDQWHVQDSLRVLTVDSWPTFETNPPSTSKAKGLRKEQLYLKTTSYVPSRLQTAPSKVKPNQRQHSRTRLFIASLPEDGEQRAHCRDHGVRPVLKRINHPEFSFVRLLLRMPS